MLYHYTFYKEHYFVIPITNFEFYYSIITNKKKYTILLPILLVSISMLFNLSTNALIDKKKRVIFSSTCVTSS